MVAWAPGSARKRATAIGLAGWFAYSAGAAFADAEPEARPIRVRIRSMVCAGEEAFWAALARRTPRLRAAAPGEASDGVDVEIVREGRRIAGRLRIEPRGPEGTVDAGARVVTGASCDEVIAAVSFMTALVFDPEAQAPPADSSSADFSRDPSASSPPSVAASAFASGRAPPYAGVSVQPSGAGSTTARWTAWAGAGGAVLTLGDVSLAGNSFVEFDRLSSAKTPWLASWRLGGALAVLGVQAGPVHGRATWRVLEVDGCPARLLLTERWILRPCLSLETGVVAVFADGAQNSHLEVQPWLSPGVRGHVSYEPWSRWAFGIDLGLTFPLIRDDFKVDPSLQVFRAPAEAATLGASIALRFL